MTRDEVVTILREAPLFGGLSAASLMQIAQRCPRIQVAQDTPFFCENSDAQAMYVLLRGQVAILKADACQERIISALGSGDCFGEMALIDLYPRSATVRALQDCLAIEISAATLAGIYDQDIKAFTLIHMNMAREMSRRLRDADAQLANTTESVAKLTKQLP